MLRCRRLHYCKMNECGGLTFFLIDDDKDLLFLITRSLEEALPGAHVVHFADARVCLQRLETSDHPSILITDLNMSPVNGFQVIEWIRARSTMRFPLIVFSGSGFEMDREHCYQLGADAFVAKGIGFSELTKCVRGFLKSGVSQVR